MFFDQYKANTSSLHPDPNIPFVPEITPDIPYNEPAKCYDLCHLSENTTELLTDSLSKYEFGNCPDKGSIAEEVRSDPMYCDTEQHDLQLGRFNASGQSRDHGESADDHNSTNSRHSQGRVDYEPDDNPAGQNTHTRKLNELKEVLTVYKNQPKTHKFGHHSEHR